MICPSCRPPRAYEAFNFDLDSTWWKCPECGDAGPVNPPSESEHRAKEKALIKKVLIEYLASDEGQAYIRQLKEEM